jgi:Ca2+-transporting ATPase
LIVLSEGDRVPADARLTQATDLSADESLLTGEAEAVRKQAGVNAMAANVRPGGHDLPQVFSGTLIVRGAAQAVVTATGAASEIGKIGKSLSQIEPETPHLQSQMRVLVLATAAIGVGVSFVVVGLYGFLRGGWPWNAPTAVVHLLGYDYPVFRRTKRWLESERSPKILC